MPCSGLASRLLARLDKGTRWPGLIGRLYSLLLRLEPPIFPGSRDKHLVARLATLIDEDMVPEALSVALQLDVEWRRRRLRDCILLAVGLLALLACAGLAPIAGLVGVPLYSMLSAYLLNRRWC